VPIVTPKMTAIEYKKIVGGNDCMDERLPNKPAIEFNKIKAAAVPDAALTYVHPNNTMSGERTIPPPVPVNP